MIPFVSLVLPLIVEAAGFGREEGREVQLVSAQALPLRHLFFDNPFEGDAPNYLFSTQANDQNSLMLFTLLPRIARLRVGPTANHARCLQVVKALSLTCDFGKGVKTQVPPPFDCSRRLGKDGAEEGNEEEQDQGDEEEEGGKEESEEAKASNTHLLLTARHYELVEGAEYVSNTATLNVQYFFRHSSLPS